MKYRVFQAKAAAENAARKIYGEAMQARAEQMQGLLHGTGVESRPDWWPTQEGMIQ